MNFTLGFCQKMINVASILNTKPTILVVKCFECSPATLFSTKCF